MKLLQIRCMLSFYTLIGANAMAMKIEADSDDVMEYLFAHYGTSAELQHSGKSGPRDQAVLLFYRTQSIRI